MALVRLILLIGICVIGFVTIECQDCTNTTGYCNHYTSYLECYINNNETQYIKALLKIVLVIAHLIQLYSCL